MKRILCVERILCFERILCVLSLLAALIILSACDAFSSREAPSSQPPPSAGTPLSPSGAVRTTPLPSGVCKARLFGKVTNIGNNQSPPNVVIEIASSGRSIKTVTDQNGLYGFAGLCAGEYAMTITPPGGKPIANPNKVSLDSATALKVDLPYR